MNLVVGFEISPCQTSSNATPPLKQQYVLINQFVELISH